MRVGIDTDFLVRLSIAAHPGRDAAVELRDRHLDASDRFVLAPQVITEFVHVVTDARRFTKPLSMTKALAVAKDWCDADDVEALFPTTNSMSRFFELMRKHKLGRKRVLDTALAAALIEAEVKYLITGNAGDYSVFNGLKLIEME
jgi:predicted nucleic acid-binding protein